jgi:hypothetical protein
MRRIGATRPAGQLRRGREAIACSDGGGYRSVGRWTTGRSRAVGAPHDDPRRAGNRPVDFDTAREVRETGA